MHLKHPSRPCQETEPFEHDKSQEDTRHQAARQNPRYRVIGYGRSCHLDAVSTLLAGHESRKTDQVLPKKYFTAT
ncbi:hypothetical protein DPMN_054113 [Dreissena polymorpha]|uniref:Uncharacterized protein n=1 Tax=Dreissena polymorpha TaxID=45954 RepID=A0A9D4CQ38_DREPO|nr:hypothetical protein DPMN_054113 [Dreissena polymorpha]